APKAAVEQRTGVAGSRSDVVRESSVVAGGRCEHVKPVTTEPEAPLERPDIERTGNRRRAVVRAPDDSFWHIGPGERERARYRNLVGSQIARHGTLPRRHTVGCHHIEAS